MTLDIQLLGDFYITYNGEPYTAVDSVRLQSLLAYLLLHCQVPQARQHLAFQLWPDSSENQARNNLRKTLYRLRQRLPDADRFLQVNVRTVQWRPDSSYTLDIVEFESRLRQGAALSDDPAAQQAIWEEAVALYSGDLCPACYDEWILPERERLRLAFIETLERLIWRTEERRQYKEAIGHANHLLRYDPLHEATYRRLMRLYAVSGDRASALQIYQSCITILRRELDVEPGPEIQQAYARLLEMDIPSRLRAQSASQIQVEERLVGRTRAWQLVQAVWRDAAQGRIHFCLIRGEAGIGKTRLAEEMLTWVSRQGIATARTRAYAAAGGLIYAPVIEWLRSDALRPTLETLDAAWLTEIARLLPELLVSHPQLSRPEPWTPAGPGQWQRQQLFEALARAVLINPQPKLLFIDNLQWCDSETLAWLYYLLQFAQGAGVAHQPAVHLLIMGTMRPEAIDADHPLTLLRLELTRSEEITEIDLLPLNVQQTSELVSQVAQIELDPNVVTELHHYTGGNPLFVIELIHTGTWRETIRNAAAHAGNVLHRATIPSLPPKVHAVIHPRLAQLSTSARELASLAAVIGRSFPFDLLWHASDSSKRELIQNLEELWQRRLVRTLGGQVYDFSHDLIRDVAYAAISPVQRPLLHRQVAQALEQIYANELAPVSAQLAAHYEQAGEFEHAIDYYEQAANVAHSLFADTDAVYFLRQALKLIELLPSTRHRQRRALTLLLRLSQPVLIIRGFLAPELRDIFTRACVLAQELGEQRQLIRALSGLRSYHQMRGNFAEAHSLSLQMLSLTEELPDKIEPFVDAETPHLITAHHGLGNVLFFTGQLLSARDQLDQALSAQRPTPGLFVFSALNSWLLGYPDRARRQMYQALVVARNLGHPHEIAFGMHNLVRLNQFLRRTQLVKLWGQKTIVLCSSYGMPFWINLSNLFLGRASAGTGETAHGIEQICASLAQLEREGHQAFCSHFWSLLAEAYACAGQFSDALNALEQATSYVDRNDEGFWHPELVRLRGEYQAALSAPDSEVETHYQEAIAIARQQCAKSLELRATISLVRLWQQQGRRTEAHAMLTDIYDWFTEGFKTPDLQEARALLAALA